MSYEKSIRSRRERIQKLKEMIKSKKDDESLEKIFARFCVATGVSEYTAKRYYELLVEAGEIEKIEE